MTYARMITMSIIEMKEKKGSSRQAILKHIASKYKIVPNSAMVNKAIKKMVEDGKLVAGAQAGKSGSGSFKVSIEEKTRIKQEEKAAAKKLQKKAAVANPKANKVAAKNPAITAKKSMPNGSKVVKKVAKAKVDKKDAKSKVAKKVVTKTPQKKVVWAKKGGMKPKKVVKKAK